MEHNGTGSVKRPSNKKEKWVCRAQNYSGALELGGEMVSNETRDINWERIIKEYRPQSLRSLDFILKKMKSHSELKCKLGILK